MLRILTFEYFRESNHFFVMLFAYFMRGVTIFFLDDATRNMEIFRLKLLYVLVVVVVVVVVNAVVFTDLMDSDSDMTLENYSKLQSSTQ